MAVFRAPGRAWVVATALSLSVVALPASAATDVFSGMAKDAVGKGLEGVRILILPDELGAAPVSEALTAASGRFSVEDLTPGTYRVAAVKEGYLGFLARVNTAFRPSLNIVLQPAPALDALERTLPDSTAWTLRLPRRSLLRDVDGSSLIGAVEKEDSQRTGRVRSARSFDVGAGMQGEFRQLVALAGAASDDDGPEAGFLGSDSRMSLMVPIHPGARVRLSGHRDRFEAGTAGGEGRGPSRLDGGADVGLSYDLGLDASLDVNAFYSGGRLDLPAAGSTEGGSDRQAHRTWGCDAGWSRDLDATSRVRVSMDLQDTALDLPVLAVESPSGGPSVVTGRDGVEISNRTLGAATSFESAAGNGHQVRIGARARWVDLPVPAVRSAGGGTAGDPWAGRGWNVAVGAEDAWAVSGPWTVLYGLSYQDNFETSGSGLVAPRVGASWSATGVKLQAVVSYPMSTSDSGRSPETMEPLGAARAVGYDAIVEFLVTSGVRVKAQRVYEPVQYGYGFGSDDSHVRPVYFTDGRASTTRDSVLLKGQFGKNLAWARLARGTAEGRLARVPAFDAPVYVLSDRVLSFAEGQLGMRLASSGTELVVGYQGVNESLASASAAGATHELWVLEIAQDLMWVRSGSASWRVLLAARTATSSPAHDGDRADAAEGLDLLARQISAGVSVAF